MRELVLTAYEYRCAFCGYDGRIGTVPVGLEAAHVRWWAFGGPDDVENGLCLCSLHHKLFDKGVLGVGNGHRVLVSQRFVGHSPAAREHVIALAGLAHSSARSQARTLSRPLTATGTPARSSTASRAPPRLPDRYSLAGHPLHRTWVQQNLSSRGPRAHPGHMSPGNGVDP